MLIYIFMMNKLTKFAEKNVSQFSGSPELLDDSHMHNISKKLESHVKGHRRRTIQSGSNSWNLFNNVKF